MHKHKSQAMQRGAALRDREHLSREEFYAGTINELTNVEIKHFHFGRNDVASFMDKIERKVRVYSKGGFRKPAEVSRLLNREGIATACGEKWTPRLVWFALRLIFRSPGGMSSKSKTEVAYNPKSARDRAALMRTLLRKAVIKPEVSQPTKGLTVVRQAMTKGRYRAVKVAFASSDKSK